MSQPWPEIVRDVPKGLELGLRNYWYPLAIAGDVPTDKPVAIRILGEDLAVWKDLDGKVHAIADRCPHRAVKMSVGRVLNGDIQCIYHGLRFGAGGRCTLIPWEPENSPLCKQVSVPSYPTEMAGGLAWIYMGDPAAFPPPPLRDSIPEELTDEENFVHYFLPIDVWDANWLFVVDGGDSYHAVTLHTNSQQHQAVLEYLDADVVKRLEAAPKKKEAVPLADRRVKIVETATHGMRGISVDLEGKHLDHGHELGDLKGERFNLPCLVTNAIRPVAGQPPYVSRMWQVPIDYRHTRVFRYAAYRATTPAEREARKQLNDEVVRARQLKTAAEDKLMAAAVPDLVSARSNEFLFRPDTDVVQLRKRLKTAFLAMTKGERAATETTPTRESLTFPV